MAKYKFVDLIEETKAKLLCQAVQSVVYNQFKGKISSPEDRENSWTI